MVKNKYGVLAPEEFQVKVNPMDPMGGEYTVAALFRAVDPDTGESFYPPVHTVSFVANPVGDFDIRKYFADKFDSAIISNGIGEEVNIL